MGDSWASSEVSRLTMKANRRRDTKPELRIRRILHSRGLRYRTDYAPGEDRRRRADIVFTRTRIAVFVDGCFWHGCPEHFIPPKSNPEYWGPKIEANRRRDVETTARLQEVGWTVMRFWEHDNPAVAAEVIIEEWTARRNQAF